MHKLSLILGMLLVAGTVQAQSVTPANKLAWNQQAPDVATANAYVYKYYADGAIVGVMVAATCAAAIAPDTTGETCSFPFPAFTPGSHSLTLTASNIAGESAKSAPITFTMIVTPVAPGSLRIQ